MDALICVRHLVRGLRGWTRGVSVDFVRDAPSSGAVHRSTVRTLATPHSLLLHLRYPNFSSSDVTMKPYDSALYAFSTPPIRFFSFSGAPKDERKKPIELTDKQYHLIADETLETLSTSFEELVDTGKCHAEFDVVNSNGVLTLRLSPEHVYVMNKQTPNRQIWLSSPVSGPKRYDFVDDAWIYLHDNSNLRDLLSQEISDILGVPVEFSTAGGGA